MSRKDLAMIYCRISDDREGERLGVERQEADCRELASRLGLQVIDVAVDNDIGASDKTSKSKVRVAYHDMLARARNGEFGTILAYSNSRLTRRVREYLDLIELHTEHDVQIRTCVSGDHDLNRADGEAMAITLASWDQAEAKRISERVRRALEEKARKGLPAGQFRRPFGFKEDQITHEPFEAELIRTAVRDIINGASITSIRRRWEEAGVRTTDGSTSWGWTPVHRVLFSWRNVGMREHRPHVVRDPNKPRRPKRTAGDPEDEPTLYKAVWEPIISEEERAQALAKLGERSRLGQRQGKWLLQGLVECTICDSPMYGALQKSPRTHQYACTQGSTHLAIAAQRLEALVTTTVFNYLFARAYRGVDVAEAPQVRWSRDEELTSLQTRIDELLDAHSAGMLSADLAFGQVAKLEPEVRTLQRERRSFFAENTTQPITRVEDAWRKSAVLNRSDSTFEERQLALRSEIQKIYILKAEFGPGSRTDEAFAKRVNIVWKQPHPDVELLSDEEWASLLVTDKTDEAMRERLWAVFTDPVSSDESHTDESPLSGAS